MEELKGLQTPTLKYWGGGNQAYPTSVLLEMISNDHPERCPNTCTTFNGNFTHRWRHSCQFDENIVHSFPKYIEYILSPPSVYVMRESCCDQFLDSWSQGVTKPNIWPIWPNFLHKTRPFIAFNLSFEMIHILYFLSKIEYLLLTHHMLWKQKWQKHTSIVLLI